MIDIGHFIWIEDEIYSHVPGKVTSISDGQYKVEIEIDGELDSRSVPSNKAYSEVHPSCLKGVDDLLMLGDFNQEALLHNTRQRFKSDKIYSFIGMPILIAVNPYKSLDIYNDKTIKFYKTYFQKLKTAPTEAGVAIPHLYHLAEAAYRDMINDKRNQSLIISGESGSGKTESTKIILKYLAVSSLSTAGEGAKNDKGEVITVEKQVLDSNPLLEAFGNAKTIKNNNSSRFGKFIQVSFTEAGKIMSARIYNYLLEKSRVVSIKNEERNYHIFYQLLLGADAKERETYKIKDLEYFDYLNQGCFDNSDADDAKDFEVTKFCMKNCDFASNEINYILSILMGILYLGNVQFVEKIINNNEVADIAEDKQEDFESAAVFLGLSNEVLKEILTTKKLIDQISKKPIVRYLKIDKAYNARDAISKALYAKMFDFIVVKINHAIRNKESSKYDKNKIKKIGLLDIFGFEDFESNSFEQLCINYANERLQQYFNNHIFKLEQEEYAKEGIGWGKIPFVDNNDIISLIDQPQFSIFSLLDSEGITPNANDISFRNNVYKHCKKSDALGENMAEDTLVINHYAGVIEYIVTDFVEKNLDQLTSDITNALSLSSNKLIKKLFEIKEDAKNKGKKGAGASSGPAKLQSDTLSKQFKMQLDDLLIMLSASNPRYVKCIKPNSLKKPVILESVDVMDQLLCAGVLEAIKIRRKGYSIRRTKEEFYKFYRLLTPQVDIKNCKDINEAITKMMKLLSELPEVKEALSTNVQTMQVGHTKIFMKEEVKIMLDYKMNRIKHVYLIQSCTRAMKVRKKVRKILNGVRKIQACYRGRLMKEFYRYLRFKVKKLQKNIRHYRLRKRIKLMIKQLKQKKLLRQQEEEKKLRKMQMEKDVPVNEVALVSPVSSYKEEQPVIAPQLQQNTNFLQGAGGTNNNNSEASSSISAAQKPKGNKKTKEKEASIIDEKALPILKKSKKSISKPNKFEIGLGSIGMQNIVDEELRKKLDALQKELDETKLENESLKTENESFKAEISTLHQSLLQAKESNSNNINTNASINSITNADMKNLKQVITEKDSSLEILTMQLEQLAKTNKSITEQFDSLKAQTSKRKEKYDKEVNGLYAQVQQLEIAKHEYERRLTTETKEERDSHALINLNTNQRVISELKNENKLFQKKFDEMKAKHSKEIAALRSDLAVKDYQLKTTSDIPEDYKALKKESELCKEKLAEMKIKLENMNKSSKLNECSQDIEKKKNEYEIRLHQKESELLNIKDDYEKIKSQVDKMKRIENVLRTELEDKETKIGNYIKEVEETREENEQLLDDIMILKRENLSMKTKIEINDTQSKARNENEIKKLIKQIDLYKKQIVDSENKTSQLENNIEKKQKVLENVKKMNLLLIDLAKIKKSEVNCIDGLRFTNSAQLKEALDDLRQQEGTILAQLAQVSKDQEVSDSDEDDEDDDEEEGEDEEGEDDDNEGEGEDD